MSDRLHAVDLGPTPYREGVTLQDALVARRAGGDAREWLLFPEHPPVLTLGRGTAAGTVRASAEELARRGIECVEVPRGGDVTWHGPGQLVAYPIVHLDRVDRDLHRWLRLLEDVVIATLARWDIAGLRVPGRTGVWVSESRKIASIGVAVRRWVGYHGVALNVSPSLADFELIHPCGLHGVQMTSMAEIHGPRTPAVAEVRTVFAGEMAAQLALSGVHWVAATEVREPAGIADPADTSNDRESAGRGPLDGGGIPTWSS